MEKRFLIWRISASTWKILMEKMAVSAEGYDLEIATMCRARRMAVRVRGPGQSRVWGWRLAGRGSGSSGTGGFMVTILKHVAQSRVGSQRDLRDFFHFT